jgi:hypothetical protein
LEVVTMSPAEELAKIRTSLIPWLRSWDLTDRNEQPNPPLREVLEQLGKLTASNPDFEPALRESFTVHALLGHRFIAIALLKRILALPGNKNPKTRARDTAQLANLLKNPDEERDAFLTRAGLSREQLVDFGRFIDEQCEFDHTNDVSTYCFTKQWARDRLGLSEEEMPSRVPL